MLLPTLVFVGGKKRSGKDFICDRLVERAGYRKVHIVAPWLAGFRKRHGITEAEYERDKAKWRPIVQAEAVEARRADPLVAVRCFRGALPALPRPLCVTGVRFRNEALLAFEFGALVLRAVVSDDVRRERFRAAGESPDLFDDPFESEVDGMPVHASIPGDLDAADVVGFVGGLTARIDAVRTFDFRPESAPHPVEGGEWKLCDTAARLICADCDRDRPCRVSRGRSGFEITEWRCYPCSKGHQVIT